MPTTPSDQQFTKTEPAPMLRGMKLQLGKIAKALSAGVAAAVAAGAAPSAGGHVYWWQGVTAVAGGLIVGLTTYFAPKNTPTP